MLTFLIKPSCRYWHLDIWCRCEESRAGSRCDKLALRVAHSKLRMGRRQGLWSLDSVITEMSVRRKEGRRGPEGGEGRRGRERERGREKERGQDIHVHMPPSAQRLLFGFFHSTALQWPHCTRCEHSAHEPPVCEVYFQQLLGIRYWTPHTHLKHTSFDFCVFETNCFILCL